MKNATLFLLLALAMLLGGCSTGENQQDQTVNPILGDVSFESTFGYKPDATTDNHLRVRTHLAYVENLLRRKEVSGLSSEMKAKRTRLLDLLHSYWRAGRFPKNYDYADQRKPCFIDKDGTICAVGYLVAQTSGQQVAESINARHKYEEFLAMNDPAVTNWVSTSGLTAQECAMIQPSYGPPINIARNHISPAYGASSAVLSGVNLAINTLNGVQIGKGSQNKGVPVMGLLTGVSQIVLGVAMIPEATPSWNGTIINNESQKNLSFINIGLGTTTLILSAWNLATDRPAKKRRNSWGLYSFPAPDKNTGLALSLTRNF